MSDYYKCLGLQRSATEREIKKAYHKLALQLHPDKNPGDKAAEARFKEVSEAYDVLSDPKKKSIYDKFGEAGLKGGMGGGGDEDGMPGFGGFPGGGTYSFSGGDASKVFEQFFGGNPFGAGGGGGGGMGGGMGGGDPFANIFSSMGGTGGMPGRAGRSGGMGGMGGMPGGMPGMGGFPFGDFGGGGGFDQSPPRAQPQPTQEVEHKFACTLEEINSGVTKKFNVSRRMQNGQDEKKLFEVRVEPGYKRGTKIRFERDGGVVNGAIADMVFVLDDKPHESFTRDGTTLHTVVPVPLRDALLGGMVEIPLLGGDVMRRPLVGVTQPGTIIKVPGQGMFDRKKKARGDLVATLNVRLPEALSAEQKQLIDMCDLE